MNRRIPCLVVGFVVAGVVSTNAQSTFMPSYSAPHRAFQSMEFGAALSFPSGGFTGFEGLYRFGYQQFDIGFRGGIATGNSTTEVLLGAEWRARALRHSEGFPLDGAVVVGFGTLGFDFWNPNAGLSVGRTIAIGDADITLTPYVEPVVMYSFGSGLSDLGFSLGLGLDARLSRQFDARVSVGIGDIEGFSIAAVWVR